MTCRPKIHTQLNDGKASATFDCGVEGVIRALDFASCGAVQLDEDVVRRRMGRVGPVATSPRDWKKAVEHPDTVADFKRAGFEAPHFRLLDGVDIKIAEADLDKGRMLVAAVYYGPLNQLHPELSSSRGFNDNHCIGFLGRRTPVGPNHKLFTTGYDSLSDGRTRVWAGKKITYPKGPQQFPWPLVAKMAAAVRLRTRDANGKILSERKLGAGLFLGGSVGAAKAIATPPPPPPPPETDAQKIARLEASVTTLTALLATASASLTTVTSQRDSAVAGLAAVKSTTADVRSALDNLDDAVDAAIVSAGGSVA